MKRLKNFEWKISYNASLNEIDVSKGYAQNTGSLDDIKTKREFIEYMIEFFKEELPEVDEEIIDFLDNYKFSHEELEVIGTYSDAYLQELMQRLLDNVDIEPTMENLHNLFVENFMKGGE